MFGVVVSLNLVPYLITNIPTFISDLEIAFPDMRGAFAKVGDPFILAMLLVALIPTFSFIVRVFPSPSLSLSLHSLSFL